MDLLRREPEDSKYRFVIVIKDLHVLKQWDITQSVVTNDDVGYIRYLIGTLPVGMKEYLIAFIKLFLRALEDAKGETMAIETLEHVIAALETALRHGAEEDKPEGARYVKVSETVVNQMIAALRRKKGDDAKDTG